MMSGLATEEIAVVDLLLDAGNPRFERQPNQRAALAKIVSEQGTKLMNLADHIAKHGLNRSELPIVIRSKTNGKYTVLEGNRRVAAIKLLSEPLLVSSLPMSAALAKRLKDLHTKFGRDLPKSIQCAVAASREEASVWIELRHLGENGGVGIIRWDGVATGRFRGESPEWLLLEMVRESEYLDEETRQKLHKIAITNIKRILDTPEARRILGVQVKDNELTITGSRNEVLGRFATVVSDIANKHIKVTQLDSKDQRVQYAKVVAARSLPKRHAAISPTEFTSQPIPTRSVKTSKRISRPRGDRKTLIPRALKLNLSPLRIVEISGELQDLPIDKYVNSCAVLLRVFLEMSLAEYGKKHGISLKRLPKKGVNAIEMNLAQKLLAVANHMEKNGICSRHELQGIRELANSRNKVFSIQSWHAYVHNQHYNPNPTDLRNNWDNIEAFFVKLWG